MQAVRLRDATLRPRDLIGASASTRPLQRPDEGRVIDWDALTEQWEARMAADLCARCGRRVPCAVRKCGRGRGVWAVRGALRDARPEIAPGTGDRAVSGTCA